MTPPSAAVLVELAVQEEREGRTRRLRLAGHQVLHRVAIASELALVAVAYARIEARDDPGCTSLVDVHALDGVRRAHRLDARLLRQRRKQLRHLIRVELLAPLGDVDLAQHSTQPGWLTREASFEVDEALHGAKYAQ